MHWILIVIACNSLPLHFPREDPYAVPPHSVQFQTIDGFESRKTCEYAGAWFHDQMRRTTKCIHQ